MGQSKVPAFRLRGTYAKPGTGSLLNKEIYFSLVADAEESILNPSVKDLTSNSSPGDISGSDRRTCLANSPSAGNAYATMKM
jgi:hypothetical protein